jgi:hypothetical protein
MILSREPLTCFLPCGTLDLWSLVHQSRVGEGFFRALVYGWPCRFPKAGVIVPGLALVAQGRRGSASLNKPLSTHERVELQGHAVTDYMGCATKIVLTVKASVFNVTYIYKSD